MSLNFANPEPHPEVRVMYTSGTLLLVLGPENQHRPDSHRIEVWFNAGGCRQPTTTRRNLKPRWRLLLENLDRTTHG